MAVLFSIGTRMARFLLEKVPVLLRVTTDCPRWLAHFTHPRRRCGRYFRRSSAADPAESFEDFVPIRGSWTWARILFSRPKPSYQCLCFVMILSQPFHRKRNVECQISRTSYVLLVTSIDLTKKQRERLESWVGTTGSVEVRPIEGDMRYGSVYLHIIPNERQRQSARFCHAFQSIKAWCGRMFRTRTKRNQKIICWSLNTTPTTRKGKSMRQTGGS